MLNVAIIPARGGSQRIPGKNIKPFCGRPIISYSVATALDSGLFEDVIVSTDSEAIARIARQCGASVPFVRPDDIADAHTGTNAVVRHALLWLAEQGREFDFACCIYATAPLLQQCYLAEGLSALRNSDRQYAFSVTSFPFPIHRALLIDDRGGLRPCFPEFAAARSQDLEDTWHDAGQFYWGRPAAFVDDVPLYSSHAIPVCLPRHLVQDIDTEEDWARAEILYAMLREQQHSEAVHEPL